MRPADLHAAEIAVAGAERPHLSLVPDGEERVVRIPAPEASLRPDWPSPSIAAWTGRVASGEHRARPQFPAP